MRGLGDLKIALILVLVSLLAISALHFATQSLRPRRMHLADVGQDDVGMFVEVEGLVRSARTLGGSSLRIDLAEGGASLGVFVPGTSAGRPSPETLQPGA